MVNHVSVGIKQFCSFTMDRARLKMLISLLSDLEGGKSLNLAYDEEKIELNKMDLIIIIRSTP